MKLTMAQVGEQIRDRAITAGIYGMKSIDLDGFDFVTWRVRISVEQGWALNCSLAVDPESKRVRVNASGAERTVAEAVAFAALYTQMAQLAAQLEAWLSRVEIVEGG